MSPVVVFILFALSLLIAIPVSITLGIVAVLPGVFDPSFTASASYVIRSMVGGIDSFPLLAVQNVSLMFFPTSLANARPVFPVPSSSLAFSTARFRAPHPPLWQRSVV